jgi:hypothetical protein
LQLFEPHVGALPELVERPNWIESVGQALAHAGSWPPFSRS